MIRKALILGIASIFMCGAVFAMRGTCGTGATKTAEKSGSAAAAVKVNNTICPVTGENMWEIDLYVVTKEGVYLYDARTNMLMPVLPGDIRDLTGKQPFAKDAPVNLVYVADLSRMGGMSAQDADFYATTDAGFVSENVYLYCASEGLATVVRGWVDRPALAKAMKLRPGQKVVLAQTVGYPK